MSGGSKFDSGGVVGPMLSAQIMRGRRSRDATGEIRKKDVREGYRGLEGEGDKSELVPASKGSDNRQLRL